VVVLLAALARSWAAARAGVAENSKAAILVTLISDIGKFNDRSFNQSQKEGLDRARPSFT
jgi:basic membrane lipoprotein Med (substrate-binding protein (PBP1-ABC) superfamily)